MAYTQDDIDELERAIMNLALGKRVTSITIDGDTTSFADSATLDDIISLKNIVTQEVKKPSYYTRTFAQSRNK